MNKGHTKHMTPLQLDANRRNGRRSRGPTTPQGKARSRLNALQHGLLSRETLVNGIGITESADELEALRRRFFAHCAPVGPIEEMLVEQIVSCCWRKRRVLRAESGAVAVSVGEGILMRWRARGGQRMLRQEVDKRLGESRLEQTLAGLDVMEETLREAWTRVMDHGELDPKGIHEVAKVLGTEPSGITAALMGINLDHQHNPRHLEKGALQANYKQELLQHLDACLLKIEYRRRKLKEVERRKEAARQRASVLPEADVMDKIQRYEGSLDRQMFRLLRQLERWQRLRLGRKLPNPVQSEPEGKETGPESEKKVDPWEGNVDQLLFGDEEAVMDQMEREEEVWNEELARLTTVKADTVSIETLMARYQGGEILSEEEYRTLAKLPAKEFRRLQQKVAKPRRPDPKASGASASDKHRRRSAAKPAADAPHARRQRSIPKAGEGQSTAAEVKPAGKPIAHPHDETNPNVGSSQKQETSISNENSQLPSRNSAPEPPQNCETNPNEPEDKPSSPDSQDGGSLTKK